MWSIWPKEPAMWVMMVSGVVTVMEGVLVDVMAQYVLCRSRSVVQRGRMDTRNERAAEWSGWYEDGVGKAGKMRLGGMSKWGCVELWW